MTQKVKPLAYTLMHVTSDCWRRRYWLQLTANVRFNDLFRL